MWPKDSSSCVLEWVSYFSILGHTVNFYYYYYYHYTICIAHRFKQARVGGANVVLYVSYDANELLNYSPFACVLLHCTMCRLTLHTSDMFLDQHC